LSFRSACRAAEFNQDLRRDVKRLTAPVQFNDGLRNNRMLRIGNIRQSDQDVCVNQISHYS
jgi:hypothetical protein